MNAEILKNQLRQIEARHHCPVAACVETFQFIQVALEQIADEPVDADFKRALREGLDRAYQRATQEDQSMAA